MYILVTYPNSFIEIVNIKDCKELVRPYFNLCLKKTIISNYKYISIIQNNHLRYFLGEMNQAILAWSF